MNWRSRPLDMAVSPFRELATNFVLVQANVKPLERPDRLPRAFWAMRPWGANLIGGFEAAAARYPGATAIVDDEGELTYRELRRRTQSIAAGVSELGAGPGTTVGLLCRNHRGFVQALIGIAKSGADVVLVNPEFAAPQLKQVVANEGISMLVHDDECEPAVAGCGAGTTLDESAMEAMASRPPSALRRATPGRITMLTSGTTGTPRGAARRPDAGATRAAAGIVGRIPFRVRDTQVLCPPLFHGWGFANLALGLGRCSTTVLSRRFDAANTLAAVNRTDADVLVVVPVMLQRILALEPEMLVASYPSSLRVIASSGSALGAKLATDVLSRFGPILYNLYGSTEVAPATIATPSDLQGAPGSAGRPILGTRVVVLDDQGARVPRGSVGRVFVRSAMRFDGYTDGSSKERHGNFVSSGDLGHFDKNGLLTIDGREDEMIISGGENVFPAEVENLLTRHPAVAEVAVVGAPDAEFGQSLAAFIVVEPGSEPTVDEIKEYVRKNLARFKVPRRIEFRDELPRTATGKVIKRELVAGGTQ
jgi:fatty-acyl-CoA synthase